MRTRTIAIVLVLLVGCQRGQNFVVWISIDGFRGDYVDRVDTPAFRRLMRQGVYTRELVPVTPSITFPSHVSEATGVPVAQHGIPNNVFYDSATRQNYKFPNEAAMLQAEPIWLTAQRQGVRTLVYEWPLSHMQRGQVKTDYFREKFENDPTDEQRLQRIIDAWRADEPRDGKPLRLIMGYIKGTDPAGHKYGPDSPQILEAIAKVDSAVGRFVDQAIEVFRSKASPHDRLYIFFTTDHGMMQVKTLVNVRKLLRRDVPANVTIINEGPMAMIYLDQLSPEQARVTKSWMLDDLDRNDFVRVYTRDTLPPQWGFNHPTRVGDIVVMLKPGHTSSTKPTTATMPADLDHGPLGMHGYPPAEVRQMNGFCMMWRSDAKEGKNVGRIDALRLHPTVAKLLGIKPAKDAKGKPIRN